MNLFLVYLRLYGHCLTAALQGIGKNAWTLLLPMGLGIGWLVLAAPISALGLVGGILLALLFDAVYSCYLYFTGEIVARSKVTLAELRKSFGAYFWSVMNLLFVLWIVRFVLSAVLAQSPQADAIGLTVWLMTLVVLNATPEVIYLRGTRGGVETITRSVRFLQDHWVEWFVPNLLGLGLLYGSYLALVELMPRWLGTLVIVPISALFHVLMVFRGHLFETLDGSTHRQRMFRFRGNDAG